MPTEIKNRVPREAVQKLATARSLTLQREGCDATSAALQRECARLLFEANREGATYEVIAEITGLPPSKVATDIARHRDDHGYPSLPRGRREGFSPKVKPKKIVAA